MWNTVSRTFGRPGWVSCGKLRTTGFIRICVLCLTCGLCVADHLSAQEPGEEGRGGRDGEGRRSRGGFDPAEMISRMDQDRNGIITASEAERVPSFIRDRWQEQGLDLNKGVKVTDLQQNAQRGMEDFRRQREEGGGRDRERGRDFERSDRPEFIPPQDVGRDGRSGATPGAPSSSGSTSRSTTGSPRSRVSPLLPEAYRALDTDFDGQIALYEWRKGKRGTISQFTQSDYDGDGFLIPKELAKAPAIAAAPATSATPALGTPTSPATPMAPLAPVAVSAEAAGKATRFFELLDADKSGTIAGDEWNKSSKLRPLFEKDKIDLAKPMNKDDFIQAYVRVGADK